MVTIYKQFDKETLDGLQHRQVSSQDTTNVSNIINSFVQYFTTKHIS